MNQTLDIIRRLRALPMTQAEISRHTGISQSRICRWEAGKIPVGADDALNLQRLLAAETTGASPAHAAAEIKSTELSQVSTQVAYEAAVVSQGV